MPLYGVLIVSLLMWSSYRTIARVFKWLTLVLLAYVVTAFVAHVDWRLALRATLVPRMEWPCSFFAVLVAILGTTISPYLFFRQAAQEVEEERAMGRNLARRRGATTKELTGCLARVAQSAAAAREEVLRRAGRGGGIGIALDYAGLDAIKLLFTTAVINGVLAPPLILIVLLLTRDRSVMGNAVNSPVLNALGMTAFGVMVIAALGLLLAS